MDCWPKCDVEVRIEVNPQLIGWPKGGVVRYGLQVNQEFDDLSNASWRLVDEVLIEERAAVSPLCRQIETGATFGDAFSEAEEEFALSASAALDLGVAGAVLALNASGCPTIYSCNGHQVGYPYIAFWARRVRLLLLVESARTAGVGLINGIEGCVEVFAGRRDGLIRFGSELAQRAGQFEATRTRRGGGRRRQMPPTL